jgi:hypothetical protein
VAHFYRAQVLNIIAEYTGMQRTRATAPFSCTLIVRAADAWR